MREKWEDAVCPQCGAAFRRSKHNPYFLLCHECRTLERRAKGYDRKYVCVRCGRDFWVSKYNPYIEPSACPKCAASERVMARRRRLRARGT